MGARQMSSPAVGARGARAGRPQPQTTAEHPGGAGGAAAEAQLNAFLRFSRRSNRPGYGLTGNNFGDSIDNPLPSAPGYLAYHDIFIAAVGGANATTNTVTGAANGTAADMGLATGITTSVVSKGDAVGTSPAAVVQFLQMTDSFGTVVKSGPGWELLFLAPLLSGEVGILAAADLRKWPSYSTTGLLAAATSTATAATGNFFYHSRLAYEIVPGYGLISVGNAALQPRLHIQYAGSGTLFSTAPSTAPKLATAVEEAFYSVPANAPDLGPFGLGTTFQETVVTCTPTVGSASSGRISVPRMGGWLAYIAFVARDVNGFRNDNVWPAFTGGQAASFLNNRLRFYLDGVPIRDESIEQRIDKMYEEFGGLMGTLNTPPTGGMGGRPAGVIAYKFKSSESQVDLGHLDSGNLWIPTTAGTGLELECTPWGSFSSGPATITAILGMIVPRGPIGQGLQGN